jgi:hypothetical protein
VRKDVQAKTEQMEKSVRVAEREYSKKMNDLNKGFEVCVEIHVFVFILIHGYSQWEIHSPVWKAE